MKFANVVLILIAVLLALILLRLSNFETLVTSARESNEALAEVQRSLIGSNQRLENEIVELRGKIAELEERVLKK